MMHIVLDVRGQRLHVIQVAERMTVVCAEYALHSQDAALELFSYLDENRGSFASVRIK